MNISDDLEKKTKALIEKRNMETEALKKLLVAFDKKKKKKAPLEKER